MAIRQRLPYWPRLRGTRVLSAAFWWWHGRCLSPCEPCVCLPSLEFMPRSARLTLPVLQLREAGLFPGVSAPVGAGRPSTLRAIEAALKSDSRLIFAVAQRENVDTVTPDVLYTTGTITKISQIQRGLGGVQLLLHGERRGTALHLTDNGRYLEAVVHEVDDLPPLNAADPAFVALHREARERAAELGQKSGLAEDVGRQVLEAARKEVDRELARLERANRDSMEAQVIRTYLETMAELPWNKRAEESLDLKRAAEILEQDHYGLKDVKDQVLEFLAVRQLRQRSPDPAQNDSFTDHYLGVPFDLSEVLFVATANFPQGIPGPLLDRLETVTFAGYTEREKLEIAKRYLVPRQLHENGLTPEQFTVTDAALSEIITSYTREAGVRQLEREIGKLGRKIARQIASGEVERVAVDPKDVDDLLGRPKVHPEHKAREDQVGVTTGMYYTPVGGDIMFVEASVMRGKGELVLTGQLGDVMKETARAALTYAKSHADQLGILEEALGGTDIHIHVPAGAIPKDGPSAGVTMAPALVSALSRRPVRHDLAMTGEITLRGRVLPIGGVKEKVLGAVRAGISTIVLPKENAADLDDLPEDVRSSLDVHLVEDLDEVLTLALRGARFEAGHLVFDGEAPIEPSLIAKHN